MSWAIRRLGGILLVVLVMTMLAGPARADLADWIGGAVDDATSWMGGAVDDATSWIGGVFDDLAQEARDAGYVDYRSGEQIYMDRAKEEEYKACLVRYSNMTCWSCEFIDAFAVAGFEGAAAAYQALAPGFIGICYYTFLVWIALQALRMFAPGGPGLGVLKGVAVKSMLLVMVLVALDPPASGESSFWLYLEWVFVPVMSGGGEMSLAILDTFGTNGQGFSDLFGTVRVEPSALRGFGSGLGETLDQLLTVAGRMQQVTSWGFSMGLAMVTDMSISDLSIASIAVGLALMFFFAIALIAFPFYIIDLLFRCVLLTALAPLAIASVLYRPTRNVTVAALMGLLQSAALVTVLGAAVGLVGVMMGSAVVGNSVSFVNWACDITYADRDLLLEDGGFWYLLCSGILAVGAMSKARAIVGALIGGFDDGKSLGDMAAGWASRSMIFAAKGTTMVVGAGLLGVQAGVAAGVGQGAGLLGGMKAGVGTFGSVMKSKIMGGDVTSRFTAGGMVNGNVAGGETSSNGE